MKNNFPIKIFSGNYLIMHNYNRFIFTDSLNEWVKYIQHCIPSYITRSLIYLIILYLSVTIEVLKFRA